MNPRHQLPDLAVESYWIPAADAGIELYVRNKRPAAMTTFAPEKILLYVHGATYPSETAFDLPIEGASMMDLIAARGYDVYLVDIRGYGRSTRPPEMSQPPEANPPIVSTEIAVPRLRHGGGSCPHAARRRQDQSDGLVVGHRDRRAIHQPEQRQSGAARAVCAAVDLPQGRRHCAGSGSLHNEPAAARRLPPGIERGCQGALAGRRPRGQARRSYSAAACSRHGSRRPGRPIRMPRTTIRRCCARRTA